MSSATRRRRLLAALIAACAAGCGASLVLVVLASPAADAARVQGALCPATATINCGHVLRSPYAWIGPIYAAHAGVIYFAFLALWYAIAGLSNRRGRHWHLVPLLSTTVAAGMSAWFIYVMAFELPVWCSWCVVAHAINGLLLALTLIAWPRRVSAIAGEAAWPSPARALAVLGGAAGMALLLGVSLYAFSVHQTMRKYQRAYLASTNNADYILWRHATAAPRDLPLRGDDWALGPANAAHTVVVFTDFECSACREFHARAPELVVNLEGRVRIVFKHFPLSRNCNERVKSDAHAFACEAAEAQEAARAVAPDKAFAYSEKLFEAHGYLAQRPYAALAAELGIDEGEFLSALAAGAGRARIREDVELAARIGVAASGEIFVDGRPLPSWRITVGGTSDLDIAATRALWFRLVGLE